MTYIDLLKRALAGETETVRLYLACMAMAPPGDIAGLHGYGPARGYS